MHAKRIEQCMTGQNLDPHEASSKHMSGDSPDFDAWDSLSIIMYEVVYADSRLHVQRHSSPRQTNTDDASNLLTTWHLIIRDCFIASSHTRRQTRQMWTWNALGHFFSAPRKPWWLVIEFESLDISVLPTCTQRRLMFHVEIEPITLLCHKRLNFQESGLGPLKDWSTNQISPKTFRDLSTTSLSVFAYC